MAAEEGMDDRDVDEVDAAMAAAQSRITLPDPEECSIDGVLKSYTLWLEVKAKDHLKAFLNRLLEEPEAARAEALTFNFLRLTNKRPEPGEVIGVGGVDFICKPEDGQAFAVEVTAVKIATASQASGLASPMLSGAAVGFPRTR